MLISDTNSLKPKRPYGQLIKSLYQVLKINSDLKDPFWHYGKTNSHALSHRRLRLGVWNIFKGNGGHHFMNDYRKFVSNLDLVLVQEALVSSHSLKHYHMPGYGMIHCGSYQRMDGLRDGVMTLCRLEHAKSPVKVKSLYAEPVFGTPKVSLISNYQLTPQKKLLVANVHATLFRSLGRAKEELDQLVDAICKHNGPMIVAGDFNTFQSRYLTHLLDKLSKLGLTHAQMSYDPRKKDIQKLDHIFTRGLKMERAKVENSMQSSDHFPLKAIFSF